VYVADGIIGSFEITTIDCSRQANDHSAYTRAGRAHTRYAKIVDKSGIDVRVLSRQSPAGFVALVVVGKKIVSKEEHFANGGIR